MTACVEEGPLGQILPGSDFGKLLTELALLSETIVETGTWKGEGSTRCLANGLTRPTQRMWSVERVKEMLDFAKGRYTDPRITFLCGSVTQIKGHDVPIVAGELPPEIDLLLLDSGEYEGHDEFMLLYPRSRWIALDDTKEQKNFENRKLALEWGWKIVMDVQGERNGWAVFERPLA